MSVASDGAPKLEGLRWFVPAPATRLAALRLIIGAYAFVYLAGRFGHMTGVNRFAAEQFDPVGPVNLIGAPLPVAVVYALVIAAMVAGAGFAAGWRYRVTGPAFAVLLLWVTSYRNSWGMVFHTENLMVLHVIALGLSPAADAWSLDARGRPAPPDSGRYGWPIRLLCAITVATYFIAGVTKLRNSGLAWVTSDILREYVAYDNARKIELGSGYSMIGGWMVRHAWMFPPLAAVSLAVELGAPLALLRASWGRVWCVLAWGFHVGVLAVMAIFFHYPVLGIGYVSFFRADRWIDGGIARGLQKLRDRGRAAGTRERGR